MSFLGPYRHLFGFFAFISFLLIYLLVVDWFGVAGLIVASGLLSSFLVWFLGALVWGVWVPIYELYYF